MKTGFKYLFNIHVLLSMQKVEW